MRIAEASLAPAYLRSGIDWSIGLEHLAFAFLNAPDRPTAWPILRAELLD